MSPAGCARTPAGRAGVAAGLGGLGFWGWGAASTREPRIGWGATGQLEPEHACPLWTQARGLPVAHAGARPAHTTSPCTLRRSQPEVVQHLQGPHHAGRCARCHRGGVGPAPTPSVRRLARPCCGRTLPRAHIPHSGGLRALAAAHPCRQRARLCTQTTRSRTGWGWRCTTTEPRALAAGGRALDCPERARDCPEHAPGLPGAGLPNLAAAGRGCALVKGGGSLDGRRLYGCCLPGRAGVPPGGPLHAAGVMSALERGAGEEQMARS